jgi:hypothetical protein
MCEMRCAASAPPPLTAVAALIIAGEKTEKHFLNYVGIAAGQLAGVIHDVTYSTLSTVVLDNFEFQNLKKPTTKKIFVFISSFYDDDDAVLSVVFSLGVVKNIIQ